MQLQYRPELVVLDVLFHLGTLLGQFRLKCPVAGLRAAGGCQAEPGRTLHHHAELETEAESARQCATPAQRGGGRHVLEVRLATQRAHFRSSEIEVTDLVYVVVTHELDLVAVRTHTGRNAEAAT